MGSNQAGPDESWKDYFREIFGIIGVTVLVVAAWRGLWLIWDYASCSEVYPFCPVRKSGLD